MSQLTEARTAVHAQLMASGLPESRQHKYPQYGAYPTPCVWVGLPVVTDPGNGVVLELPVVLAFDGEQRAQVEQLDERTAGLWDALRRVDCGAGKASVTRAEPQAIGPEGSVMLAVVLTVQVPLSVRTLCDSPPLTTP